MKDSTDLHSQKNKIYGITGAMFLLLCALFFISLFIGKYPLSLEKLKSNDALQWSVFWNLRFSRVFVGCVGGIAIGMTGFIYQMVFKNPLASPDILGVSSGASAGAAVGIIFFSGVYSIITCSFVGAIAAVLLALLFAFIDHSGNKTTVVLAGIAVHALAQMVLMLLKRMADPEKELASIEYWIMGELNGINTKVIIVNIPICIVCLILLCFLHRQSLLLSMDEMETKMLGVKVANVRLVLLFLSTLSVASIVSMTGIISFVGLIAPHFARRLTRNNQIETMFLSGFLGGIFLLIADMLARSVAQTELPVSIFTSMIGVPFLIVLIIKRRELA